MTPTKAKRLVADLIEAAKEYAFRGSKPPEDHAEIDEWLNDATSKVIAALADPPKTTPRFTPNDIGMLLCCHVIGPNMARVPWIENDVAPVHEESYNKLAHFGLIRWDGSKCVPTAKGVALIEKLCL